MIVLDASLVGPLSIPDEADDVSTASIELIFSTSIHVPAHWRLEVANMLRSALRRGRLTIGQRDAALRRLQDLPVTIDQSGWDAAWSGTVALSDRHGLTPYDAAYLELAGRLQAMLATRDRALAIAAQAEGIRVTRLP